MMIIGVKQDKESFLLSSEHDRILKEHNQSMIQGGYT